MAVKKTARIVAAETLSPSVRLLTLEPSEPLGFVGGQYLIVDSGVMLPNGKEGDTGPRADNPARTMLGATQLLWLQRRLLEAQQAGVIWKIIAISSPIDQKGAFQGSTPRDAYLVKCDKDTTTQNDINLGRVNVLVGFAPLKPAEFVIIQIQQFAGNIAT